MPRVRLDSLKNNHYSLTLILPNSELVRIDAANESG
jgi:hypothetical protein